MKPRLSITIALLAFSLASGMLLAATKPPTAVAPATVLPAGTTVDVQLTSTISTSANQQGDPFTAEVEDPIFVRGEEVIPAGSMLRGHITFVKPPGRVKGKAEMRLVADAITTKSGKQFTFTASLANAGNGTKMTGQEGTIQGAGKSVKKGAEDSGIGAAAGAGVGAIAAGGQGALYGAGIGAVAGLVDALAKHHKHVVLQPGTELTFVLSTPASESTATKASAISAPFLCANCR